MTCTSSSTAASIRIFRIALFAILGSLTSIGSFAQSAAPAITIAKPEASAMRLANLPETEKSLLAKLPANFYHFGAATVGEQPEAQPLTLEFATGARVTKITSTADFKVERGSSCAAGTFYQPKTSCVLLVRFTPQGAGHRLGKVTITHTADANPVVMNFLGFGYLPVVSFTPGVITTVPSTVATGQGVLSAAQNLFVDGGDTLYIADTGNNAILYLDSSGILRTISSGTVSAPYGVAADSFGDVYFSEPAAKLMFEIFNYGSQLQISGTGSDSCTYAAPCKMPNEALYAPGTMAMDANNNLFFSEQSLGAAVSTVLPYSPTFARIYDPFTYQESPFAAFTVDAADNLYSHWYTTGVCAIVMQTFSDSVNSRGVYTKVAGGRACGFSGDGGRAGNAELGTSLGQMVFDIAGNLYFSDKMNNRVRRIDANSGIIRTIAGNGTSGYTGDGGPATAATLIAPTGVGIDSRGEVYIISGSSGATTAQVVRKVGVNGALTFAGQVQGTPSAAQAVTITNTGNTSLTITKTLMTGANTADFIIDPITTTCDFTAGNYLYSASSCQIGIIFKPSALGARAATLKIFDNSVSGANYVALKGTGSSSAAFKITAPAANAQVPSGTAPTFSVSVTSPSGPAPTGTVTFKSDGKQVGKPVTIAAGAASVKLPVLATGTHTISATYNGDARYAAVTAAETVTITP